MPGYRARRDSGFYESSRRHMKNQLTSSYDKVTGEIRKKPWLTQAICIFWRECLGFIYLESSRKSKALEAVFYKKIKKYEKIRFTCAAYILSKNKNICKSQAQKIFGWYISCIYKPEAV